MGTAPIAAPNIPAKPMDRQNLIPPSKRPPRATATSPARRAENFFPTARADPEDGTAEAGQSLGVPRPAAQILRRRLPRILTNNAAVMAKNESGSTLWFRLFAESLSL
jgi:hypothetical protein